MNDTLSIGSNHLWHGWFIVTNILDVPMLYRRFVLVVSLIAVIMGVGMANLVHATKEHRDVVREYPGLVFSKTSSCAPQQSCSLPVANTGYII